jgi:hypothetical protein
MLRALTSGSALPTQFASSHFIPALKRHFLMVRRYVKVCLEVLPVELAVRPAISLRRILLWGGEEKKLRITKKRRTPERESQERRKGQQNLPIF